MQVIYEHMNGVDLVSIMFQSACFHDTQAPHQLQCMVTFGVSAG